MVKKNEHDRLFLLTGLSPEDLADTIESNPRSYMNLKGAVAEKHLRNHLERLEKAKAIEGFRCGAGDFEKDFYVQIKGRKKPVVVECKNAQVAATNKIADRRAYLEFLLREKYLEPSYIASILPRGQRSFEAASKSELDVAFKKLPITLRESGVSRYRFSRELCKITPEQRLTSKNCAKYLSLFDASPITIDFQRTRNTKDGDSNQGGNRFYNSDEVDVLAVCLFNRTLEWDFIFCSSRRLVRHVNHPEKYANTVVVNPTIWKADLLEVL